MIEQVGYAIDNTTKTRAIFEINKGTNKDKRIDVNAAMLHEDRRIPFENMIYVADGPSDVPVFSVINQRHGRTFAVYAPDNPTSFRQAKSLQDQGRVQSFGPADYTAGSHTYLWLLATVDEIASRIVETRSNVLYARIHRPPAHLTVQSDAGASGAPPVDVVGSGALDGEPPADAEPEPAPGTVFGAEPDDAFDDLPDAVEVDSVDTGGADWIGDADASPLARSPLDAADDQPPDEELANEQTDRLVEICSTISAESDRPITWRELNELRLYLGRRLSSRANGDGEDAEPLTREDVEAQLAAIRARSD